MGYLRKLALAAIAAAAMLAFGAGSASAAELYSTGVTVNAGTTVHATLESGTSLSTSTTDAKTLFQTCTGSTFAGVTTNAEAPILIDIEVLTWSGCSYTTDTLTPGRLSIAANGTVSGSGTVWTINPGASCRYGTGAVTTLGTLATGKIAINAVINEQEPKAFLCPDTTKWVANYTVTSPHDLTVE